MSITINGGAGVTFPDSVLQTNAITNTGGDPPYYAARAWVNFNGTTAAIRAQTNILSVVRTAQGRFTVTMSTAMPDANYVVVATAGDTTSTAAYNNVRLTGTPTSNVFQLITTEQSSGAPTFTDFDNVHVVIFR